MLQIFADCALAVLLNAAMVTDLLKGKIPNMIPVFGLMAGFFCQLAKNGPSGLLLFAGGAVIPFAAAFPLFAFRAVGAGDVKLLMAAGGFLGPAAMPECLLLCLFLSAGTALLKMLFQRSFGHRFSCLGTYLKDCVREGRLKPYEQDWEDAEAVVHLSVPILISVFVCMIGGVV